MTAELGRRTFIRRAAVAGAAAAGPSWAAGTASAAPNGPTGPAAAGGALESSLRDARMVWSQAPRERCAAPFLGDNALSVQVFLRPDGKALRFSLGAAGHGWDSAPAFLDLVPVGAVTGVRLELDLWNAELTGTVTTTSGTLAVSALVARGHGVLLVSSTAEGGERAVSLHAGVEGGAAAKVTQAVRRTGSATVVAATAGQGDARRTLAADHAALLARHRGWWHDFYARSYLSVPDRTVQRFHWTQLYTAACLLSPQAPAAQSAPTLLNRSGHTDLGGVVAALGQGGWTPGPVSPPWAFPGAGSKAGPTENLLLAWGAPQIWDAYRHTADESVLRELLHPLLRSAVDFYSGFLVTGSDGRFHLPVTYSPGYGDVVDSTHDLSLLRWAATALVDSTRSAGPARAGPRPLAGHRRPARAVPRGRRRCVGRRRCPAGALARAGGHLLWLFPLYEKRWSRPATARS